MTYRAHMQAQSEAYLRDVLERARGSITKAAQLAGMNKHTFYSIVRKAKLVQPRRVYGNASWRELRS